MLDLFQKLGVSFIIIIYLSNIKFYHSMLFLHLIKKLKMIDYLVKVILWKTEAHFIPFSLIQSSTQTFSTQALTRPVLIVPCMPTSTPTWKTSSTKTLSPSFRRDFWKQQISHPTSKPSYSIMHPPLPSFRMALSQSAHKKLSIYSN